MDNINHASKVNDVYQNHPKYYVNRLSNPITINQDVATNFVALVVNLNEVALEVKVETMNFAHITQEALSKKIIVLTTFTCKKNQK